MTWYYAEAGRSIGPIEDEAFQNLVKAGVITLDTMVWNEESQQWQPYRELAPASLRIKLRKRGEVLAASGDLQACAGCGGAFALELMTRLGSDWVCANCRPAFVRQLREGTPATAAGVNAEELIRSIRARGYKVQIGANIRHAFRTLRSWFWRTMGVTLLVGVAWVVAAGAAVWSPILGVLAAWLAAGPLLGGLCLFYLRLARGEVGGLADAASGFGSRCLHLVMAPVAMAFLTGLLLVPGALASLGLRWVLGSDAEQAAHSPAQIAAVVATGLLLLVGALGVIYLCVGWVYVFVLIMDKRLGFWQAMRVSRRVVARRWWGMFGLLVVLGMLVWMALVVCGAPLLLLLLDVPGAVKAGVGVVAALATVLVWLCAAPFVAFALLAQYQAIFGSRRPTQ
jgi:hypothetical protein